MAFPADKQLSTFRRSGLNSDSTIQNLIEQQGNLIETVRLLCAKLDLDGGVTDNNYGATLTDAAIATAPRKLV